MRHWSSGTRWRSAGRDRWQLDGIDVRAPLLIVCLVGLLAGMSLARGGMNPPFPSLGGAGRITGTAHVIDGDTMKVHGVTLRLQGIDAPERRQLCLKGARHIPCGREASRYLADRIGGQPVSCEPIGIDPYRRTLAICFKGGEDLNAVMVRDGQAVAYRYFSHRYVSHENEARAFHRGVWATVFENPYDWRQSH